MFIKVSADNLRLLKVLDLVINPIYNLAGGKIEFQVKNRGSFRFIMPIIMKKLLFNPFSKFAFISPKPHLLEEFDDIPENFYVDFLLYYSTADSDKGYEGVIFSPLLREETPDGFILIQKFDYYKIEDDNYLKELIDIAFSLLNPYCFFPAIPKNGTELHPSTVQFIYLTMFPYFLYSFIDLILSENFVFVIKRDDYQTSNIGDVSNLYSSLSPKKFSDRLKSYGETPFEIFDFLFKLAAPGEV